MEWVNPRLAFPRAEHFAFLYENAHLLLITFHRDNARFLFLIRGEQDGGLQLDYPGDTFTERVLETVSSVFTVRVQEEGQEESTPYVLGSYFQVGSQPFGAYYVKDGSRSDVVLFKWVGEAPDFELEVPTDAEYRLAATAFEEQHQDFLAIQKANRE